MACLLDMDSLEGVVEVSVFVCVVVEVSVFVCVVVEAVKGAKGR